MVGKELPYKVYVVLYVYTLEFTNIYTKLKNFLLYVYRYIVYVYICTMCVPTDHGCQKRTLHPLGPELQMVVG